MQIDLLATNRGELGLLSNHTFDSDVSGVIFDADERSLTLEFGESMDSMKLNVPIGDDFFEYIRKANFINVIAIEKGRISYATQAMLMKVSMDEEDFY